MVVLKVVLRKKNRCGEFKCECDCDRECLNCFIMDIDIVCLVCGICSYCKLYFGRDVDLKLFCDIWRYLSYGCYGVDCIIECFECDVSLGMVFVFFVCLWCGICVNCKFYFGEDVGWSKFFYFCVLFKVFDRLKLSVRRFMFLLWWYCYWRCEKGKYVVLSFGLMIW